MRAALFREYGGTEVLEVADVPRPDRDDWTPTGEAPDLDAAYPVAPDEVVVEVAGAGVNPVDTYFREGSYEPFTLPTIAGVDVAGTVTDAPAGSRFDEGDPVVGTGVGMNHFGSYAEYAAVPEDRLAVLPEGADRTAAAGLGVAAVTAWRALVDHAGLEPAETCLVHGGSGGVGHAAVQLAAVAGADVVTTAAPEYHDRLRELGADAVLDYGRDDLADAVRDAAGGGVDVILDHRLDEYLTFDAEVAAHDARVVGIGENEPAIGFDSSATARGKDLTLQLMSMFNTPRLADPLASLAGLLGDGDLEIEVARTYDLDEAAEAQRAVMEDSFLGKLVVTP